MAIRSTQGRNRAARSTQGGVTLMVMDCGACNLLSLSGLGFQIKYIVTSQKNNNFLFKTFFCKNKYMPPPLYTDLGLSCTLFSCEC